MTISLCNSAIKAHHRNYIGAEDNYTGQQGSNPRGGWTIIGGNLDDFKKGAKFDNQNFRDTLSRGYFPNGLIVQHYEKTYRVIVANYSGYYKGGKLYSRLERIG